jgi:hypothetical protein
MSLLDENLYVLKLSQQPRGSVLVLKTEAVRERFAVLGIADLRFEIVFREKQAYWKESRNQLLDSGVMHICELTFNPLCNYSLYAEWRELSEYPMVSADLYAIPVKDWRSGGFSKEHIYELIDEQIRFLMKASQKHSRWRIDVNFLFREKLVSSRATCLTNSEEVQNELVIGPRSVA